ncbi:MAG: hypothetical protein Q7J44_01625 [Pseudotabrizicola sp.]|uniref:hypothetical protein n=1 Tax=Pseudotabrizicola sp. TaxID=2939647 RepID=UPI00271C8257|nr:hypothetical protein [Pseudotabrizicola sp.]MDO9637224.1 hypothetical protein [Pseudotabrizicola sp.]
MTRARLFGPRLFGIGLCLTLLLGCAKNDLADPPVPLGDFALGLNIVVTDKTEKVPISRNATGEEWQSAMKKAVDARFGRYQGTKLYNIGISVDGYALAPPGIPVVAAPKSILVITANIWDDAAGQKLNADGKQITVFESLSGETVIGTGLTRNKQEQMDALSYNAVKRVEEWLLQNPEWFGLPPRPVPGAAVAPTVVSAPVPGPVPRPVPASVP